jgi:hypothetical protein
VDRAVFFFFLRSESSGVGWESRMSDQVDDHGGSSKPRDRMEADTRDEALSVLGLYTFPFPSFLGAIGRVYMSVCAPCQICQVVTSESYTYF